MNVCMIQTGHVQLKVGGVWSGGLGAVARAIEGRRDVMAAMLKGMANSARVSGAKVHGLFCLQSSNTAAPSEGPPRRDNRPRATSTFSKLTQWLVSRCTIGEDRSMWPMEGWEFTESDGDVSGRCACWCRGPLRRSWRR